MSMKCFLYVQNILFQEFANVVNLVPLAEKVVKLTAVCGVCSREAAFTKRKSEHENTVHLNI